jgi:hypothetical protein
MGDLTLTSFFVSGTLCCPYTSASAWSRLKRFPRQLYVLCGRYDSDVALVLDGIGIGLTPSSSPNALGLPNWSRHRLRYCYNPLCIAFVPEVWELSCSEMISTPIVYFYFCVCVGAGCGKKDRSNVPRQQLKILRCLSERAICWYSHPASCNNTFSIKVRCDACSQGRSVQYREREAQTQTERTPSSQ